MKLFRVFLAIALSALSLTVIQSCKSDNPLNNPTEEDLGSVYLYDYDFNATDVEDASFDDDFDMEDCNPMHDGLNEDRGDKGMKPRFKDRFNLGRVFGSMNLTEEQKLELRNLMAAHRACEMEWFSQLNEARRTILAASNAERRAIIEKAKSGEITRSEANVLIQQLNNRVRQALANLPINEEVRAGLILCREAFFASISELLTEEQLVIWERFLANLPIR